jgi:DNA-binding response OmpR family regulator
MERRKNTVLIVDDDPDVLAVLCEMVDRAGFDTFGAGDAAEAFHVLRAIDVDVLITDLNLQDPDWDGLDFCNEALRIRPRTRCLIVSGEENPNVGPHLFYRKPISGDELVKILKSHLLRPIRLV